MLPIAGAIKNGEKDFYGKAMNLKGKNVLLIGFSEQEAQMYVDKYDPACITMLTKWDDHVDAEIKKYQLFIGDICKKTHFEDNYFDAVLTLSVSEHLDDLGAATKEILRITKNGGNILHFFGPAWSCAYGHHLFRNPDDSLQNFSLWSMPAHMHLLCTHEEIRKFYLEQGYSEETVRSVLHWFDETPIINRLFFDDYIRIFNNYQMLLDSSELMYNILPVSHLKLLQSRFPGKHDFSTYGAKMNFIVNKSELIIGSSA